jgi:hypothetical protein
MRRKIIGQILSVLILASVLLIAVPVNTAKASPGTLELVDPVDGDHLFSFTTAEKAVGDTFLINVTVTDVQDLFAWQIKVTWDPTLLEYVERIIPPDNVFAGKSTLEAPPAVENGSVALGVTLGPGQAGVNVVRGTLVQIKLKIIKGVSILGPTKVECDLKFVDSDYTFLLNSAGAVISVTWVEAHYSYEWVAPAKKPKFYLSPSTIKPAKKGDIFTVDVMIADVDPGWEIIGFQFSVMWNTTLIEPVAPYWDKGTFLEAFQYAPDGVLYMASINDHPRPPPMTPIPDDYNFSTIALVLQPDPNAGYTYHPPFPSGSGKLATLYFKAIYETIAPEEVWSKIEFITFRYPDGSSQDMLVLNKYGMDIGYSAADPANYRAPQKTLGLAIDVYTQYPSPYGGQGKNMPSDMFGPQQQVELFATVTYNAYPVQQKLVGFEIHHGDYVFWREATTDSDGVAHISFRIPWPCENPEDEIFGKWYVIATVEVAERKVNDTLAFWVWWPVEILSIVPNPYEPPKVTEFYHRSKTVGDPMTFTVKFRTYSMQTIPAVITTTVYDELGFFIGSDYLSTTVGWNQYNYYNYSICEEPPAINYTWDVSIPMPTNAVVGYGTAYANAFDKFPWLGGTPYCPEAETPFQSWRISKS